MCHRFESCIFHVRKIRSVGRSKPPLKHLPSYPCFNKIYRW
nr:MAG TPA: hypothetical protein [Caudoviricetes sp.]